MATNKICNLITDIVVGVLVIGVFLMVCYIVGCLISTNDSLLPWWAL